MKQIFATWLFEPEQGKSLAKMGAENRLLSYYHTMDKEAELTDYVRKGKQDADQQGEIIRNT